MATNTLLPIKYYFSFIFFLIFLLPHHPHSYIHALKICFHVNDFNHRGSTRATFEYAHYAKTLLGHHSIIIAPMEPLSNIAKPLFEEYFQGRLFVYRPDPMEYQLVFGRNLSIGGKYMVQLIEDLQCDMVYVLKYGSKESPPSFPSSFSAHVPSIVHSVFVYQPHDNAIVVPLNDYIHPDHVIGSSLPHIVSSPSPISSLLIRKILALRASLLIPQDALVICGFGGHDSFDVNEAEEAVYLLSSIYSKEELNFVFMGLAPSFIVREMQEIGADVNERSFTSSFFPSIHVLPSIVDDSSKEAFIGSCDALLHARSIGETFGLAVAEFSVRNKPVLTFNDSKLRLDSREHLRILGDKAFLYQTANDIVVTVADWMRTGIPASDYNAYRAYGPEQVMEKFNNFVLKGKAQSSGNLPSKTYRDGQYSRLPCVSPYCDVKCIDASVCYDPIASQRCDSYITQYRPPSPLRCSTQQLKFSKEQAVRMFDNKSVDFIDFIPIGFVLRDEDVLDCVAEKAAILGTCDPANKSSYLFSASEEYLYRRDMAHSYYSFTHKKGGWDCMRHYEIMAATSVPYFLGLQDAPKHTLPFIPRELLHRGKEILDAARYQYDNLNRTVSINPSKFEMLEYYRTACCIRRFAKQHLTSISLARYMLQTTNNLHAKTALILLPGYSQFFFDYMAMAILHGFSELLGAAEVAHFPDNALIYEYRPQDIPFKDIREQRLWGHGFSWTHRMKRTGSLYSYSEADYDATGEARQQQEQLAISILVQGIQSRAWDVVVFTSFHRGLPLWNQVAASYPPEQILIVDGEDFSFHEYPGIERGEINLFPMAFNSEWRHHAANAHFFKRELEDSCPIF